MTVNSIFGRPGKAITNLMAPPVALALALALAQMPQSARAAWAASPIDEKKMVVLKASGSMWGATEDSFSRHAFSLRSHLGVALWQDKQPEVVVLLNPENRTFLPVHISEYIEDNNYGAHTPLLFNSTVKKDVVLPDGTKAVESTLQMKFPSGHSEPTARVVSIQNIQLTPAMAKAWCAVMLVKPDFNFPVSLYVCKQPKIEGKKKRSLKWINTFVCGSIEQKPLNTSAFTVPKDYKRANDKSAFYFSDDGNLKEGDLTDLFRRDVK